MPGAPARRTPNRSTPPAPRTGVRPASSADPAILGGGIVLLIGLVVAAFWQTRAFGILNFDDDQYLDPLVRQGLTWNGFARAWTTGQVGNWHPLTTLSFMLDAELFGDRWGGYHIHNVVLHALATVFLFAALARLTGATGRSLVAAAVFAVHPLRAESVAWITERKDVLSGVFLATTLLAYAFYVEKPSSRRRYAALLGSFVAGLLSKSMLVTLPVGLLILDWWPLGRLGPPGRLRGDLPARPPRAVVLEKLPLLVLAAASAVATVLSVGDVVRPIDTLPFAVRASSSVVAYACYVGQLFWPVGLVPHYPYSSTGPTTLQVAASAAFVSALTALAWFARRRWPSFATGWAWYLVTLLPVIGFIPGGIQLIADRYTYVSQIWLVVAVVWAAADLVERVRIPRAALGAAVVVGLVVLAGLCHAQVRIWRDSETLWRHTLAVTRDNAYAHANLASVLAQGGDPVGAAEHNRAALAIESDNLIALSNLATLLADGRGAAEALRYYELSVKENPKFAFGWLNMGNALRNLGRLNDADAAWQRAAELEPRMAAAWSNLAGLRIDLGEFDEAIELAGKAEAAGGGTVAAETLGRALERAGRFADAAEAYRRAVAAGRPTADTFACLGRMLERTGRLNAAAAAFRRSLELAPGSPTVAFDLAGVLEQQGARTDAATLFRRAAEVFEAVGDSEMARTAAARAAGLGEPPPAS